MVPLMYELSMIVEQMMDVMFLIPGTDFFPGTGLNGPVHNHQGPLLLNGLTSIPAWISNFINYKVWDEINLCIPNFKGATNEV